MIKVVVAGAAGRMGTSIINLAAQDKELEVIYGLEALAKENSISSSICPIGSDISQIKVADVVINFATAEGTMVGLRPAMLKYSVPWVIGTTGFNSNQEDTLKEISKRIAIVKSSNMSLGVNAFFKAAQQIAKVLPEYDVHIQEAHHIHKKDSPSGTALQVGKLIADITGRSVKYASVREGEIVGDHRVTFSSAVDTIEIFHHAETRDIFALGALQAAKWLVKQKRPGLYSMQDVLGMNETPHPQPSPHGRGE
jgi:4-hydroxy-tetrahydrodipicolinate reductase